MIKLPKGMPVLDMRDPDFGEKLGDALGVKPGDEIQIVTPQFTRTKHDPLPGSPPLDWNTLRTMNTVALREMGLRPWDEPNATGTVLMLIPGEWHHYIPEGFELECINGKVAPHKSSGADRTDDDIRFGCLAYGIRASL